MKTWKIIFAVITSLLISPIVKSQNELNKDHAANKIRIKVLFKGMNRVAFNMLDSEMKFSVLDYGNPTKRDTVIIRTIISTRPMHFRNSSYSHNNKTKELEFEQRDFILLPGDSIDLTKDDFHLSLTNFSRYNYFLDSIYNIKNKPRIASDVTDELIVQSLRMIEDEQQEAADKINKLYANKKIDSDYKLALDNFNIIMKYSKTASVFNNDYSVERIKKYFKEPVEYIRNNQSIVQNISSPNSHGLLYLVNRYDAKILGRPMQNYWDHFDAVSGPLKVSFPYRSYVLSRLETDRSIKTIDQYKQLLARAKQSGIYDARFDSLLISKQNAQNINNLKGKGILTAAGKSSDYFAMLQSLKGQYVLVDFWASWCGPCRAQMPTLRTVKDKLRKENIAFVSVSIDNDNQTNDWLAASQDEKLDKERHNYRLNKGNKNALLKTYNFSYVPRYMLYDKQGVLLSDNFTAPTDKNFEADLLKYIKK